MVAYSIMVYYESYLTYVLYKNWAYFWKTKVTIYRQKQLHRLKMNKIKAIQNTPINRTSYR